MQGAGHQRITVADGYTILSISHCLESKRLGPDKRWTLLSIIILCCCAVVTWLVFVRTASSTQSQLSVAANAKARRQIQLGLFPLLANRYRRCNWNAAWALSVAFCLHVCVCVCVWICWKPWVDYSLFSAFFRLSTGLGSVRTRHQLFPLVSLGWTEGFIPLFWRI